MKWGMNLNGDRNHAKSGQIHESVVWNCDFCCVDMELNWPSESKVRQNVNVLYLGEFSVNSYDTFDHFFWVLFLFTKYFRFISKNEELTKTESVNSEPRS
jgi:hypothetical protein